MREGDKAPDFERADHLGRPFHLAAATRHGPVVLFFYPKDGSPLCTAEACAFRDGYHQFEIANVSLVGISGDTPETHAEFARKHNLPFRLLSDADGSLRDLYVVRRTLGIVPGRTTYVIDEHRVIRLVFSSQRHAQRHVDEAIHAVKSLHNPPSQDEDGTISFEARL